MILDLHIPVDRQKAETYFAKLLKDESAIELKKIHQNRTNSQNRYVHALFAIFGFQFGYTIDEAKATVKRKLGYIYEKNGTWFLKKTSLMSTAELSEFIDRFRNYGASVGCYLPTAEEFNENYVEMMKQVAYIESQQSKYGY